MLNVLIIFDVLIAIALITLILFQRGPGATAGAAFGSGASGTVFGARGSANFLTRATAVLAAGFFLITLVMAMVASRQVSQAREGDLGVMAALPPAVEAPLSVPAGDGEVPTMTLQLNPDAEAGAADANNAAGTSAEAMADGMEATDPAMDAADVSEQETATEDHSADGDSGN